MILYSHFYDLIAKLLVVVLLVACLFIIEPEQWETFLVTQWGMKASLAEFLTVLSISIIAIPIIWLVYLPWLSPAAAWCYLRFSLKTQVSWEVAKEVESLFRPTLKRMEWYPLSELKNLPQAERVPELLRFFNYIQH